jgi:hypothetical protein
MKYNRVWAAGAAFAIATLFLALAAVAQETSTSNPPIPDQQSAPKTDSQNQNGSQAPDLPPAPAPTPAFPVDAEIHAAGRSMPWVDSRNPLHLGPISLASLDFVSIYDEFYPTAGGPSDIERLNLLRANIVFDKTFSKNRIFLQFTPILANLNGHTHGNTGMDNSLTFGTMLKLTPRLTLTLKDEFALTKTRQLFPNDLLLVDQQNGGVVQGYFLEFNGTHVQNTFSTIFDYKITPRWILTVAPGYTYSDTYNPAEEFRISDSVNTVSVTYLVTPRINVGALETVELMHPITPVATNGLFETSSVFYSEQLTPTLWFTGRVGGESAKYPGFNGTTWAASASASLLKVFSRGSLALAYYRGSTLTNFLTNRQTDHTDISYSYRILRQLSWTSGIGYFRIVGAEPREFGKYGLSTLQYLFPGGVSLYGSYTRRDQRSTNQLLISGDRNTFVLGIRWEPGAAAVK